jgi:hypothetical protein
MAELSFEKYQERLKTSIDSPDRDIFHHSSLFSSEMAPTKNSYMDGDERESTQIYEGEYRDIYEFQTVEKDHTGVQYSVKQNIDVFQDGSMVAYMSNSTNSRGGYETDTVKVVSKEEALEIISNDFENLKAPLEYDTLKPLDTADREYLSTLKRGFDYDHQLTPAEDSERVDNLRSATKSLKMSLEALENGVPFEDLDDINVTRGHYPSEDPESTINTYGDDDSISTMETEMSR